MLVDEQLTFVSESLDALLIQFMSKEINCDEVNFAKNDFYKGNLDYAEISRACKESSSCRSIQIFVFLKLYVL
jgi:hypothetical protein